MVNQREKTKPAPGPPVRRDILDGSWIVVAVLPVGLFLLAAGCFGQSQAPPNPAEEAALKLFLRNYVRDLSYDYKKTRFFSTFVDLKDDGTRQVIVYFTDQNSCGSGGCTTLILASADSSYKVITSITIGWPPIRILDSKSNGWHDLGVWVQGGGVLPGYEAKLSFDGKAYPRNPTVPPAQRLTGKALGRIVVPVTALTEGGKALYP